jgi:myo-inositol 2-dehydrogenase/D-chiro-inositol 1-dehydrogenase
VAAASSPVAAERDWAEENIEGVKVYSEFDDMLNSGNLDAIVVASVTSVHAEQTLRAIEKGYHVLCEKPLTLDLKLVRQIFYIQLFLPFH